MPQPENATKKAYGKKTTDDRASRNAARAKYEKANGKCSGDVHHKDGNPKNNSLDNLECSGEKSNRGWRKGKKGYDQSGSTKGGDKKKESKKSK